MDTCTSAVSVIHATGSDPEPVPVSVTPSPPSVPPSTQCHISPHPALPLLALSQSESIPSPSLPESSSPSASAPSSSVQSSASVGTPCGTFRTDKIAQLTTVLRNGRVSFAARVLSQDHRSNAPGGTYSTRVQFEVLAKAERRAAMQIIGKEAAWASLVSARQQKSPPFYLLGKGVTDLAEPLIKAHASLPIVPHACAQIASATCTCGDFSDDAWCKHLAAVGYHIT